MSRPSPRWRWAAAATAVSLLVAASCGSDDEATEPSSSGPAPSSSTAESSVPDDVPTKIVSVSPTGTEMLFAIGAGDQVIAVDDQSNYPPEAAAVMTDLSGFTPNVEAIAALEPDLVVTQPAYSGELEAQLEALGIEVFGGDAAETFDEIYTQIEQLGAITGHVAEAAELVANMQADIAAAVEAAPDLAGKTYFHELDDTLYSIGTKTFVGAAYEVFGLENIADADSPSSDYPQLTNEAVIAADPDFIFLADTEFGSPPASPESVAARPGWGEISAVRDGNVIPVDADLASRWGPRIVDYIEALSAAFAETSVTAGS